MTKTQKNLIWQSLAIFLCAVMVFGVLPISVFAIENLLTLPESVSLTNLDGTPFVSGQEITPGQEFYITYNYGTVGPVNASIKYPLPTLSNQLEVVHGLTEDDVISIPLTGTDSQPLGTLEINTVTGAMTFQFHEHFDGYHVNGFFLRFGAMLDEEAVEIGRELVLSFPVEGGAVNYNVSVVDAEKDSPQISKSGALSSDVSESGHVEILWTITVKHAGNPHQSITIRDTWYENQEYVDGSLRMDGVPVSEGLTLDMDGKGFQYEYAGITPDSVDVFTYKTRIKSSAFLNKNGIPLTGGNILCKNTAQVFYPGDSDIFLTDPADASYSHPIKWLYKTSGDVIDRETGEMEWTVTIYNNGLSMQNVVLYDRLSPGVSIKGNTATIQVGNNPVQTLYDFKRTSDTDIVYNGIIGNEYNLSYPLGNIGNVAVIKYRTVITDMGTYDAGAHLPPDSIFDNRAFITYQLPSGAGLSSVIASPVVVKSGGYDEGLLGKEGVLEPAYHTVKWTVTVNKNNETLTGVQVTDRLTYADPILPNNKGKYSQPGSYRLCNHIYDDDISRNRPQYSFDGKNFFDFTLYDKSKPNVPFTYEPVPMNGQAGAAVYEIVYRLGDINKKVTIVFRSTATDAVIFANNVTSNNCHYENKATLATGSNAFSYASADVVYKSNALLKADARSWHNKTEHSYNYDDNQLPWLIRVNTNQMEMTDICITDILSAGTSLVEGSLIVGLGTGYWYNLASASSTVSIPKYKTGASKPYYTYDEGTRELKIYLEDIVGGEVGTSDATKQIVFYVQVDVNHPIFNDPTYTGYIPNKNGTWSIPNNGVLDNNHLSGDNAVKDGASYNISVQHMKKSGTAFKNGAYYSIDYSLSINRIQQTLPNPAVIQDTIPAGLRLDVSTLHLYEASAVSPDMFSTKDDGTNGKLVKGMKIDPQLYQVETTVNDKGATVMRLTLPQNSGNKMYIAEYSCDVTDVTKAPFTNSVMVEGVELSKAEQTTTRILLTSAAGGGTLMGNKKTIGVVHKTDAVTDFPVEGAVFGIYYNGLLLEKKTTDENGEVVFDNLNEGYTYTITELEAAPGYLEPIDVTETFIATGILSPVTLAITNTQIEGTAQFVKTDPDGVSLAGAVFGIWTDAADIGGTLPFATATSGKNGVVSFTSLTAGNTYYIAEITAPEHFIKSGKVIVVRMGLDGAMEKLWLFDDENENAITAFENSRAPVASLVICKAVTGNMGDRTKAFSFTLQIGASVSLPLGSVLQATKQAANGDETTVSIVTGEPYTFTLSHEEQLSVSGLVPGTEYTVSENDYSIDGYTTSYVTKKNATAEQSVNGRSVTGAAVSGTNTEAFTNTANVTVPTGVLLEFWPYALLTLLAALGGVLLLRTKKKRCFERKMSK